MIKAPDDFWTQKTERQMLPSGKWFLNGKKNQNDEKRKKATEMSTADFELTDFFFFDCFTYTTYNVILTLPTLIQILTLEYSTYIMLHYGA